VLSPDYTGNRQSRARQGIPGFGCNPDLNHALPVGFSGALRRAELAAIRVERLEACERGLRLTPPDTKGERTGRGVTVAIPYGSTELCPVRALRQWQQAAGSRQPGSPRRPCGEAISLPGSGVSRLEWPEAQQRQPVRMALAGHQLPRAFAVALGPAAAHKTPMVQEEL